MMAHHKEYSLSYLLHKLKISADRESGENAAESRRTLTLSARNSRTPIVRHLTEDAHFKSL